MPDIEYDYTPVPTIWRFSQSHKFIRGLMGPFGSGKSSGCVMELVQWAARQLAVNSLRRSRFVVVRNTYGQLRDTSIKTWLDWVPDGQLGAYAKSDHAYFMTIPLEDGTRVESEVLFRALDREEHVANLLSLELTGAWVNEAREIPWSVIRALQGRVGRYPAVRDGGCVDAGLILDTNPPDDESWWYKLFETDCPDNAEIFKQPSGRSPGAENLANLPADYYTNMMKGADPDFIRVHVDGDYGYVRDGKPVFPEYNDAQHCSEVEPVAGTPILRGWDFGISAACVFTQLLPNGCWIVFEELIAEDVSTYEFADGVLTLSSRRWPGFRFEDYGDPAGEQRSAIALDRPEKTHFDVLHGKGIDIRGGEQNIASRLECVRKPLNTLKNGRAQLQLHPRCEMLRKGFRGRYQFRRVKIAGAAERYHDVPDKNEFSHPHDALQYVATSVFGGVVRGREEGRQGLKLEPLEKLYPEWAARMRKAVV